MQMLLSQFEVQSDGLFALAESVRDVLKEPIHIQRNPAKIDMADAAWIAMYIPKRCERNGLDVRVAMQALNSVQTLHQLKDDLKRHFSEQGTLVTIIAGGAIALLGGVRFAVSPEAADLDLARTDDGADISHDVCQDTRESHEYEVFLIDPHMPVKHSSEQTGEDADTAVDFNVLRGFGCGGRGWTNIRNIVLKGQSELGIEDDAVFLSLSSTALLFFSSKPSGYQE
eukprot:m.365989 g.365989  ORF g.365989 m.365989 type:complete len:227 (-) comp34109_c0_seq1:459-1139(-)